MLIFVPVFCVDSTEVFVRPNELEMVPISLIKVIHSKTKDLY